MTILLAEIFTGLSYTVYQWLLGHFRGRRALTAVATLMLLLTLVIAPLLAVLGAAANEALSVTQTMGPRLQQLEDQPDELDSRLRAIPGYDRIAPYRAQILIKTGELVGSTSAFLFAALSATTRATAVFVFQFFVLLYTMFFFLTGGPGLLRTVLAYLPLTEVDKQRMPEKFVSVTRAKGTILIGVLAALFVTVLGNVRHGVPQRARRTRIRCCQPCQPSASLTADSVGRGGGGWAIRETSGYGRAASQWS